MLAEVKDTGVDRNWAFCCPVSMKSMQYSVQRELTLSPLRFHKTFRFPMSLVKTSLKILSPDITMGMFSIISKKANHWLVVGKREKVAEREMTGKIAGKLRTTAGKRRWSWVGEYGKEEM